MPDSPGGARSTREVLVVEDEPDMVATYERLLRRQGCRTTAARSCAAGLAAIAIGPLDLLITDLRLPDGDGVVLVRAARALPTPAPVIVVSGFAFGASREAATQAGATAILSKPFSTEEFTKLVRAILEAGWR
jgi:CheY-like chemotaxis protein